MEGAWSIGCCSAFSPTPVGAIDRGALTLPADHFLPVEDGVHTIERARGVPLDEEP
jgi:hypothetical protein